MRLTWRDNDKHVSIMPACRHLQTFNMPRHAKCQDCARVWPSSIAMWLTSWKNLTFQMLMSLTQEATYAYICTFMCCAWIAFGELTVSVVETWCWKVLDFSKKRPSCFPGAVEMLT